MMIHKRTMINNGKEVQYTFIENGNPAVCFMFCGAAYTYDKPLLYYSTMLMIENKYDVVHIHYSFKHDILELPLTEVTDTICEEINPVITEVMKEKQYPKTVFLGKSLGTIPIINGFMKNDMYLHSKMVLLTPLLKFEMIYKNLLLCKHSSIIVIGEKDTHYIPSRMKALEKNTKIQIETVPNANHSLDVEPLNTIKSITALEKTVKRLDSFLNPKAWV
ncbi:alpha/beta hydrolase [Siminovitchia sp. 179-K 8D1 HS]|uniref:alpha/beta hydrolase n=1 Tax=Siminovitchia sp. 179-K 8D1 HS TaxID=3142385 RepID=UPI0039A09946